MTHPLTDKICGDIAENLPDYNAETCMRSAADWQLEQVIEYIVANDWFAEPGRRIAELRKAMRPQEDN